MTIESKMTKKTLKELEKIAGKLTLGKLIWAIRKSNEVTQVDFAEMLGVTKQHLCDIEHERKAVSPKLAASYAKLLGYSRQQFIRLALQDLVDRDGLDVQVEVAKKSRGSKRDV